MATPARRSLVLLGAASRLFAEAAMLRLTGSERYGRALIKALDSADENLRTIAATLLARAGPRVVPMLEEALQRQQQPALMLTIIGDLGGEDQSSLLEHYAKDERPDVAGAAREALRVLHLRKEAEGSGQ